MLLLQDENEILKQNVRCENPMKCLSFKLTKKKREKDCIIHPSRESLVIDSMCKTDHICKCR